MNKATMLRKMFACLAILGVASAAPAQEAGYTILDLGALGESTAFSSGGGINEAGQITGAAGTSIQGIDMHPFRWQPSSGMQDLGTLGGTYGAGFDINEAGQVVGYYIDASSTSRGFLWDAAHGMQDLGTLSAGAYSFATGINDAGLVVGASNNHTFLWDAANGMQDLGTFGGNGSGGGAINNAGLVAGSAATHFSRFRAVGITESHGFIWDSASNTTTVLTPLPGRTDTQVAGINEAGQVVGTSGTVVAFAGGQGYYYQYVADEAFLWQDGVMTGLGKLPGASVSTVSAINNVGQVVGMSGGRLFLWDDGVLTELNSLIDPSLGWSLISVSDINDRGHIVGSGEHHGVWRAFLLSPNAAPPMRAGDYDGDLDVDGGDFLAWQRGLGSLVMPSGSGADGDDSGKVDAGDLTVWQDNFGAAPSFGSSIAGLASRVPEPASIVLTGVGLASGVVMTFRERSRAHKSFEHGLRITVLLAALTFLGMASAAPAAVLFTETFSYPDGRLASAPPTGGVSGGIWTASHPLGFMPVFVSNGKVILHDYTHPHQTAPLPESVWRGFSALNAGQTIYASLDVSASGNSAGDTFAAFMWEHPMIADRRYGTRLLITPASGSDFTLGIGIESSLYIPTVSWPSGLTFGVTYRVVMSYEFDTGSSKLWVNPVNESSTYVSISNTATRLVSAFQLRQYWTSEGTASAAQVLDNLVVGTTFDDVFAIPALLGDFNGDAIVDGADLTQWTGDFGLNDESDADGDGDSDGADFLAWQQQFGSGPAAVPTNAAVPEPATVVMLFMGTLAIHCRPRRTVS